MKKTIYFILFLLLLFTACSKENEENIRPIIDLPCEEQGTYFLSATIGDSVLCYASDSTQDDIYSFVGIIRDLSDYYGKDTSILSIPIQHYDNNNERILTIHYTIPIYSKYEMKPFISIITPFYDRIDLVKSLDNKTYTTQNIDNTVPGATADFYITLATNNYNDWRESYLGRQDSSYIRLFDPVYLFDTQRNGGVMESHYRVSYETQTNLYDVRGNYLYPFKAKGTFLFYFLILN
ncbi:hypothetical protein Fleli_1448 [Bernardetia litoralis DSM 6794]|uniref:Lipoprotein n=1 Tax=Bernardetia litoralis (strain ATCC 23117 / DSM 6794 / NBRC 15988 / NCIMB 1366 / Fx l1 / Sio-4) TaxID=880071 RepID=I4AIT9_BERLS|nr:hypothetical protein [Bernardetia litoralis]AFM03874.1 hypothetical protein Fleli_1448 [Bernardetia litoralis DSM 6794]